MSRVLPLLTVALILVIPASTSANPKGMEFFETKIRPVLAKNCFECHSASAAKVRGGLLLDSKEGVLRGGGKGPAVIPGNPANSLLIKALNHDGLKMPETKLPANVIADFVQWVAMGAPDPREKSASTYKRMTAEEAKTFWSFVPVKSVAPPAVKDVAWSRTDIDRFVLAKLADKGLKPVGEAERHVLIRRVYFDLTGLPPSTAEVDAFVSDKSPEAFETVVDQLLASPRFGERWGRHWLDVARYAESNGNTDNTPFPNAYRYRDYVIAGFNKDKPYDQFIREQVAGDLLKASNEKERDEFLTATGFLALASKPRAQNNPDFHFDLIGDQIDVTSRAVLGLSVMCSRCHDHKFDQISTKEYYALAGIFDSTTMLYGEGVRKGGKNDLTGGGYHHLSDKTQVMGVAEGKPTDTAVCIRGESTTRGETVPRGFLKIATVGEAPKINRSGSGRKELAEWLVTPKNPLAARVAANRIWLHLFGQGLVRTPDNFGFLGERPSHPELLDYLAGTVVENGWSTKKLIRTIVLSRAYQASSAPDRANMKADPENVWLWRMAPRRLEGEAIRDAMLVVSGNIDFKRPAGSLAAVNGGNAKKPTYELKDSNVRSVYLGVLRGRPLPELLAMFDTANPSLPIAQREVTTVPAQSLYLLNSPWVVTQARSFAQRVLADSKLDDAGRVDLAYRMALCRTATDVERSRALTYIRQMADGVAGRDKNSGMPKAWASFCQSLLASAEFRYVE